MAFNEARIFILALLIVTGLALWFYWPLAIVSGALLIFVFYFFRDPERAVSADPRDIVSAADGRVISVDEEVVAPLTGEKVKRVAVFLSVFDVHVNRAPYEGKVIKSEHKAGKFLDARDSDVDLKNENRAWQIETARGTVVVQQIAGLIARRIVAWKQDGEPVAKGERFGMIRFGSRTDVYLPRNCEVVVKPGERVQGAATVIARWPTE